MSVYSQAYDIPITAERGASPADAPLLDERVLEELIAEVGIATFLDFVGRMSAAALSHHARLSSALLAGDDEAARLAAHALCGLLGHFGLKQAACLSHAIETSGAGPQDCTALESVLRASLEALPHYARKLAA